MVVVKMRAVVLVLATASLVAAQSATTGRVLQLPIPQTTNRSPSTNTQDASANTNGLGLQLPIPQTTNTNRPPSTTQDPSANTNQPFTTTYDPSASAQPMGTNTFGEPSAQTQDVEESETTDMPSAAPETSTFSPSPTPSSTRPSSSSAPPSTSSKAPSSSFSSAVPSTSSSASPSPPPAASSATSTPPPPPRVSGGALAGVVIGSVLGAVLIVGLAYILIRRRHVRSLAELGTFNVDEETAKPTPYIHGKVDDETSKPPFFVDEEPKSDPYAHASDETLPKTMLASYPPVERTDEKTESVASQIHPTTPSQPASSFLAYMHRSNANAPRRAGTPLPPVPLRQTSLPDPPYAPQVASRRFHAEDALDAIEGEELPPMYNPRWAARRTARRGDRSGIGRSATTRL